MRLAACLLLLLSGPARALSYEGCTKVEMAQIESAVAGAIEMSAAAAAAVADDAAYGTWFGRYSPRHADMVRARLKAVHAALLLGRTEAVCVPDGGDGCKDGTYAYVYRYEPYRIHLCTSFHHLPAMFEVPQESDEMENGTREGTIIHEMSHFAVVAGTEDTCYARSVCRDMAASDPFGVILNADSFQYYAEDVAFLPAAGAVLLVKTGRRPRRP